ncbi:MAG: DUF3501 family protein [Candidatus Pelagibacterales bacterium]|jgi:hypothetical protein|tara:strand:+ start:233 stop:826 length:594 start_codon:yes stop_codon:yes gene_type:complete
MTNTKKQITSEDLLSLDQYTLDRKEIRKNVVEVKKDRRISLGPHATFYFENYFTMKAQIQEMLYIEKGGDEQLKDELAAYNPMIPQGNELVATFMFEIDNPIIRKKVLGELGGVEHKIYIQIGNSKIYAIPEGDVDRTDEDGKTSSVHFLHFKLKDEDAQNLKNSEINLELGTDHPKYAHKALVENQVKKSLAEDLD